MKRIIHTHNAPQALGPYSQAIEADGILYISGQIPVNPADGSMPEEITEQTICCLDNIGAILEAAGYSYRDVVKSTVLLDDMDNFNAMNEIYAKYYTENMPTRVCYEVSRLPKGAKIEIETIAVK